MPGGGLEPNEDSSTAAIREVMEEAGVIGHLARCLGSFEVSTNFDVQDVDEVEVHFYLLPSLIFAR